jgi:hypothetical protein
MNRDTVGAGVGATDGGEPLSLLDQLKARRAQLAAQRGRELKKLDRAIQLMEASKAEDLVAEATALLAE